ncbi:hypothetical protein F4779DRAFT_255958 [Xylariaceae sp. FL0662B]|nr:hypothetical protein F4779DRAFT_255958 [Xylariaceae sp. FL0662B]
MESVQESKMPAVLEACKQGIRSECEFVEPPFCAHAAGKCDQHHGDQSASFGGSTDWEDETDTAACTAAPPPYHLSSSESHEYRPRKRVRFDTGDTVAEASEFRPPGKHARPGMQTTPTLRLPGLANLDDASAPEAADTGEPGNMDLDEREETPHPQDLRQSNRSGGGGGSSFLAGPSLFRAAGAASKQVGASTPSAAQPSATPLAGGPGLSSGDLEAALKRITLQYSDILMADRSGASTGGGGA